MDDLKTYPVNSRLRHNGKVYGPGTDHETVDMTEEQAATLLGLGILGEPVEADDAGERFDADKLKAKLAELQKENPEVSTLAMAKLKPLLGGDFKTVKRDDVDAAFAAIKADEE